MSYTLETIKIIELPLFYLRCSVMYFHKGPTYELNFNNHYEH